MQGGPISDETRKRDTVLRIARQIARYAFAFLLLVCILAGLSIFDVAAGRYMRFGTFRDGDRQLDVMVADSPLLNEGLIEISNDTTSINIILDSDSDSHEWDSLVTLWNKARKFRSPNPRIIGQIHDTPFGSWTYLTIIGGPHLRLILQEEGVCIAFDVPPDESQRVDRAIAEVTAHLAGKPVKPQYVSDRVGVRRAFEGVRTMWTESVTPSGSNCSELFHPDWRPHG